MPQNQLINQPIHWLDSNELLAQHCSRWEKSILLSVDTEFMRSRTYYPIAGLFQINDGEANYLIDPQAIDDFSALQSIFSNPDIVKVLHSCSEDLEVFDRVLGCLPVNLLDTQIAAAMLGYGFSVGFANLCKSVLDVELPKSETRSNWLTRPLSESQIHYAAIDVEYLTLLAIKLIKELKGRERLTWVREECEKLNNNFYENQSMDSAWQRNRSAWKLDSRELYCFKSLSRWREEKAQRRDVPRNRVVKDHTLFTLAQRQPGTEDQLRLIEGMSERMVRGDGEELLALIEESSECSEAGLPARLPRPLPSSSKNLANALRDAVQLRADELNLSAELLVRKKDYEEIIRLGMETGVYRLPEGFSQWRTHLIGNLLLDTCRDQLAPGQK